MRKPTFPKDTNLFLLIYKLLYDLLFLLLVSFGLMLIFEGALPLFVSGRISFSLMLLPMTITILCLSFLAKKIGLSYQRPSSIKSILMPLFVIYAFVLIGNSLLKFKLWENLFITILTLIIFFVLYAVATKKRKKVAQATPPGKNL